MLSMEDFITAVFCCVDDLLKEVTNGQPETVIGQLCVSVARRRHRFSIEKVWARDMWHLTSRLNRKVLAHTVCVWLNRLFGLEPLQFDSLVTE